MVMKQQQNMVTSVLHAWLLQNVGGTYCQKFERHVLVITLPEIVGNELMNSVVPYRNSNNHNLTCSTGWASKEDGSFPHFIYKCWVSAASTALPTLFVNTRLQHSERTQLEALPVH
jgi:hypothetical protein